MQNYHAFIHHDVLDMRALKKHRARFQAQFSESSFVIEEAAEHLLARLDYVKLQPAHILVFGWQTDLERSMLAARYPDSEIISVVDMDAFAKLKPESVQLVVANMALQWLPDPRLFFYLVHTVLQDQGLFLFTTVGPDTLGQLHQSFQVIDDKPHVHAFTDMHHLGDCLKQLGFDDPVMDMQMLTLAYDDLGDLFQDLRALGASNIHVDRTRGLLTPVKWQAMLAAYEAFKQEDFYPVTLELVCGQGWKVPREQLDEAEEVVVSLDQIKRR